MTFIPLAIWLDAPDITVGLQGMATSATATPATAGGKDDVEATAGAIYLCVCLTGTSGIDQSVNSITPSPPPSTTTSTQPLQNNNIHHPPQTNRHPAYASPPPPSPSPPPTNNPPETSTTIHGPSYRPFHLAHSPTLSPLLPTPTFLTFLNHLNHVWLANPYLQALSATSNILGFIPSLEAQLAALGMQVAAELGTITVSKLRTKMFLREANETVFGPVGLRVRVLGTEGLLRVLGVEGDRLGLGEVFDYDFEQGSSKSEGGGGFDPVRRRMDALREYVAPVVFVDDMAVGNGGGGDWVRKVAWKQEEWFTQRQNRVLVRRHRRAVRGIGEAEVAEKELLVKMEEVEAEMMAVKGRAVERLSGPLGESLLGRGIVQDDLEKGLKQLQRKMEKLGREREKGVTKRLQQSERTFQRVRKREAKIAQKVIATARSGRTGSACPSDLGTPACRAGSRPDPWHRDAGSPATREHHHALPQLRVVLVDGLAVHQLRPDDVTHSVGDKHGGRHDGFLGRTGYVAGTEGDDKADNRSEEAGDGVSGNWNCRVVSPVGLPDHHAAGDDGETAGDEHGNARVRNAHADVTAEGDEDDADPTHWELEQNGVEGVVAKG
ncbi:uncharacterized protein An12g09610 [Aspergillus niger]|uniref:Contig An12c0340, genomic contig n=2 Tax=Aspergillus niger TaxID=5061 RepID=A2R0S5_ASPNC|nr:uncharacterized protein An12g09610 [Aspergillus niger]CAL00867.1 unnamed protein product [Aspergillus niger]